MADAHQHEKRRHFRGNARAGRRVELTYRALDPAAVASGRTVRAVTRNIGVGGAFIATAEPEAVGTRLEVELEIPTSDQKIPLQAEVRWVVEPEDDRHDAGMGVRFLDVDVETLVRMSEYFASLTGSE
jgi:uncharacterized protein (TIGR02266 family)